MAMIGPRSLIAAFNENREKPPYPRIMNHTPDPAMTSLATTVAHAAPSRPRSSQKMKIGSSTAFTAPATSVTIMARDAAPWLRSTAEVTMPIVINGIVGVRIAR